MRLRGAEAARVSRVKVREVIRLIIALTVAEVSFQSNCT